MQEQKEKILEFVPWEIHVFPKEIRDELERRKLRNLNFNKYNDNNLESYTNEEPYKGPMRSWVRVCSNGMGAEIEGTPPKPGFVFYGGTEFYNVYGFNKGVDYESLNVNESVIGYTPDGMPHVLKNNINTSNGLIHVPIPQIVSVQIKTQRHLFRKIEVEWVCFSPEQLEYMTPYFLALGVSVIVEWGWNNFNLESLLDLNNIEELKRLYDNQNLLYDRIIKSNGNYDVAFGIISNFSWRIEGNKISCTTEISSLNRVLLSQSIEDNIIVERENDNNFLDSFINFVQNKIDGFKKIINYKKTADEILKLIEENVSITPRTTYSGLQDKFYTPYGINYRLKPKEVKNQNNDDHLNLDKEFIDLIKYIKQRHPDNYKEYIFGIFFGRSSSLDHYDPNLGTPYNKNDFDSSNSKEWWINMGLLVEIINYFSSRHINNSDSNSRELFKVEIDDCVISAHPNLISGDGNILLIPNALAPRYFYGIYGYSAYPNAYEEMAITKEINLYNPYAPRTNVLVDKYKQILSENLTDSYVKNISSIKNNQNNNVLKNADLILFKVIRPLEGKIIRDDLSKIINHNRIYFCGKKPGYEFPFSVPYPSAYRNGVFYKPFYTGFVKNLYFNVNELRRIIQNEKISDYMSLYEKIFQSISKATCRYINLMLNNSNEIKNSSVSTLKIVDLNLGEYGSNSLDNMYIFDYLVADSNVLSLTFNPMPHYAQTADILYNIRKSDTERSYPSFSDQLLEYKFSDRLFTKTLEVKKHGNDSFISMMKSLQNIKPSSSDAFQMVIKQKNKDVYYRLAIPSQYSKLLNLLLSDRDMKNNPTYTGIMPNIQMTITIQGIGGIRTFSVFGIRNLPEPYSVNNIMFQTVETVDVIQNGSWKTSITAGIRLRRTTDF